MASMSTRVAGSIEDLIGNAAAQGITGDARMDRAVACAAALFLENRIADVRMTDVAEKAGIGVATLYRRFSTKGRLALAAGTLLWRRFNERITDLVESDAFLAMGGANRLERMLRLYAEGYVENAGFVLFIDDLDRLLVSERMDEEALGAYAGEVDSFYLSHFKNQELICIRYKKDVEAGISDEEIENGRIFRIRYPENLHPGQPYDIYVTNLAKKPQEILEILTNLVKRDD